MQNLFEQFQGADIHRLVECLKAIQTAGLSTSKHTQAGVNQSSGNVWVWNEDWAGCVACSIGFDVAWWHSCSECGEEYEFDSYEELQEYIEKYEGQCQACKPRYVAGWNMPGFLPDSEPQEFSSAEDALEYIKDQIRDLDPEIYPQAEEWAESIEADKNGEFGATIANYHYFVTKA